MGRFVCALALLAAVIISASIAHAQNQRTWVIDFENLTDSDVEPTRVSNQYTVSPYTSYGVRFSIDGKTTLPVIAVVGAPTRAFGTGFSGNTSEPKFSSGTCALTNAWDNGASIDGDIRMDFDPPISSAAFYLMDVDNSGESFTIRSYRNNAEITSLTQTITTSSPNTSDGKSTPIRIAPAAGTDIDRIVIQTAGSSPLSFAIDFLTYTRVCASVAQCPKTLIRISQESAPNAADFSSNILGFVTYFLSDTELTSLYAYGVPDDYSYNGLQIAPIKDRTHSWLATTTGQQVALMTFHDIPGPSNGGGRAEMKIAFEGGRGTRCSNLDWGVQDEPDNDPYYRPSECVFGTNHSWLSTNSDGFAIKGIDPTGRAYVSFDNTDGNANNSVITGVTDWYWYTPTGAPIKLALAEGRRVRLDLVPPCPADLNIDAFLSYEDFDVFVDEFANGTELGDFDRDGFVTFEDFDAFVAAFEAGC